MDKIPAELLEIINQNNFIFGGIVNLGEDPEFSYFERWLANGSHGELRYLEKYKDIRRDPRRLLPDAKSLMVLGMRYGQRELLPRRGDAPRVAQYARFADYHKLFWRTGQKLIQDIHNFFGQPHAQGRVISDSAPILERSWAVRSGMGFRGKNTCVISPKWGSLFLLGEILSTMDIGGLLTGDKLKEPSPGRRQTGGCGTCKRCQVHCPTGALTQDYVMDARRCISYWTIEQRGTIPEEFWPTVGRYVFGCDICQLVCPYNRTDSLEGAHHRPLSQKPSNFLGQPKLPAEPDLFAMAVMTQAEYERLFGGTPMTRSGREGLMRNALIALFVTKDHRLVDAINLALQRSDSNGVVHRTVCQINQQNKKVT